MDEYGTAGKRQLPVALETPRERLRLVQTAPNADFLSQLIAEHEHLPPQRVRRRAPVSEAVDAYANGGRIAVRRLPAGYRTSVLA